MNKQPLSFPKGFYWGTATSAHQVEGGLINDWSEWEKSERRLAYLKGKNLDPLEYQSGLAANSWEHLEDDITCIKELNNNAYRFSLDWSRIEAEEGKFNEAVIEKYHSFIKRLKEENIEPFVTLWHWPVPLWLRDKGGWENKNIVSYFERFTKKIVESFPEVKFWLTLNEPNVYAGKSYLEGSWPPEKKNPFSYFRVTHNLIKAHKAAYTLIKKIKPSSQVGIVSNLIDFDSAGGPINNFLAMLAHWLWNDYFLKRIKNHNDIIGVNFYFHNRVNYGFSKNKNEKVSDMGWELYPQSIKAVLLSIKKYNKPMYITENGLADNKDVNRAWYITEVLRSLAEAIQEGADVRGYFHWSLLDNFEWAEGFGMKFGLFSIDRKTWKRIARPSTKVYAEIAKHNQV